LGSCLVRRTALLLVWLRFSPAGTVAPAFCIAVPCIDSISCPTRERQERIAQPIPVHLTEGRVLAWAAARYHAVLAVKTLCAGLRPVLGESPALRSGES